MGGFAIGQGVSRFEDLRLILGCGSYVDDIHLPGMAYGVVLRSLHAHAKIRSIDTSRCQSRRPACWQYLPVLTLMHPASVTFRFHGPQAPRWRADV